MKPRLLDAALIVVGGILYAASFPPYEVTAGIWIALVPLLAVSARATPRGAFVAGAAYGGVFFAGTVPWVFAAVASYFSIGTWAAVAFGGLVYLLFVAPYVGLFALVARRLLALGPWQALAAIPALWVAGELARARLLTGLPWELVGHALWRRSSLIQIADLGGVYAVSYLVATLNVGIYLTARAMCAAAPPRRRAAVVAPLGVALLILAATALYGVWRIDQEDAGARGEPPRVVVLVQGNQSVSQRWERIGAERALVLYAGLSRTAIARHHPDLVVWPEYAVTLYPQREPAILGALAELARASGAGLVFGAPRRADDGGAPRVFNSAYLVAPDGGLQAYDKVRLVPLAEYRPLRIGEALAADGDATFSPAARGTVLASAAGRLGVLICYEAVFPELARALVRDGAEILLNLSNDGWLDRAGLGAGAQHFSMTVFRAVETRRYLARATTAGISGFVDPLGRPFATLATGVRGVTAGTVRARHDLTPYVRHGDAFAVACVVVALVALARSRRGS